MEEQWEHLTDQQRAILRFIADSIERRGYPPSIREIGQAVGITSTSVVSRYLERLVEEGLIERERRQSRGIRLSEAAALVISPASRDREVVSIPLLGVIAAGEPIPVPTSDFSLMGIDETVELTRGILGDTGDLFALQVKGNSMIDALVHDGDIVIMRAAQRVENGEMAAVWLPEREETTLKRVFWEGRRVRLQPANPAMEPIYIEDPSQIEVQGKVVMVIRRIE